MSQQQQQETPSSSLPEYRSVSMSSTPSMPSPMLRSAFSFQQHESKQVSLLNPTIPLVPSKTWQLSQPLPMVPAGYMLERNQIHLTTNTPQEIANRISECLRLRSFVIQETEGEIKNAFRAESGKGLLFRVNFFSAQNELIVEFQRLAGCSYEFQKTFQACHRSVHGQKETKQELEFPTCVPASSNRSARLLDTFSIAMDMLDTKRVDSHLMGLEVLEPMSTNSEIVPLIFENLNKLLKFFKGSKEPLSQLEQQQDCLLKRRALSVVANALETSQAVTREQQAVLVHTMLDCLVHRKCQDAHQSFQMARCLVCLAENESTQIIQQSPALSLLAKERSKHLALEQEYQKLESILLSS